MTYNTFRAQFQGYLKNGQPTTIKSRNTWTIDVQHNGRSSWLAVWNSLTTPSGTSHGLHAEPLEGIHGRDPLTVRSQVEARFEIQCSDWEIVGQPGGEDWTEKNPVTHTPAVPILPGSVPASPIRALCNRQTRVGRIDLHHPTCQRCKQQLEARKAAPQAAAKERAAQ